MATTEKELTDPVDIATPDGRELNSAARGWSRFPVQRANLKGAWGRNKRWDYWAILAGDLVISAVYADIDYLGLSDVWWADLETGEHGGRGILVPGARGMRLPEESGLAPLRVRRRGYELEIADDETGTHLRARWTEPDGATGSLDATVELPPGHESLNVMIPWSRRRFQFTSKHQARPASGVLEVGDRRRIFGREKSSDDAWGVLDVGRGRWPYRIDWNWGGGAGRTNDGQRVVGLQLGGRWTRGTDFTENGILVDGRLEKIGDELDWTYDWNAPLQPWRVEDPHGRLRLELTPRFDKHSRTEAGILGTEVHQVFGTWTGSFRRDDGTTVEFEDLQGFAEEARFRW